MIQSEKVCGGFSLELIITEIFSGNYPAKQLLSPFLDFLKLGGRGALPKIFNCWRWDVK
jgi:hypothetical protein